MKPRSGSIFRCAAALPVVVTLVLGGGGLTDSANAADLYWDGADLGPNADGGAGTWNTSNTNWDSALLAGTAVVWNNATPDNAFFTGVGGTISLGTNITAGTVNILGPSYTFSSNTLTLDSINISAGFLSTINSTVAGRVSNTVAINGGVGSVLAWNGGSSISTLNLNSGIVRNGTVANSATLNVAAGGLLEWNTTNPTPTAANSAVLVLNRGVMRTTGSLTHSHIGGITFNGGMLDFNAGSYHSESMQLNGNVTVGTGTFTGTSWLLQTSGDNSNRGLAFNANRTFTVGANNELRVQAELEAADSGTSALTVAGSGNGKIILLNTVSYTGGTTINGGTLQLGDLSAAGTGTGTAVANGLNGGTGTVTVNASGTLAASHATLGGSTYLSNLLAGSGTLRVIGAGHFGLSGNTNTFSGTVDMRSSGQLNGGLTLDYTTQNNNKLGTTATLNLNGGNLRVLGSSTAATSQTVGSINILGGNLITLTPGTGQNVSLIGTSFTQSSSGMLTLRSTGTLGTTANLNVGAATLGRWATTQNTSEANTAFLTKDGSNNAVALQFTASAATSAEAAGTGTLASQGASSVYLANSAQTITADLTIDSLASQNDVLINNGALLTLSGGGLILRTADHWIQTSSGTRGRVTTGLGSGELFVTVGGLYTAGTTDDFQIRTDIVDNGLTPTKLVVGGTGGLILGGGGANAYTGGTIINSGRVQLTNVGALGTGNVEVRPGGQLYLNAGNNTFARNLTLAGLGSAEAGSYGALRVESSPTVSGNLTVNEHARINISSGGGTVGFTGVLAGSGDLEIRSLAGSLAYAVFSNASNSFTGRWIVRDGNAVLRASSDAAFGAVPTNFRNDAIILDGGRLQFGTTGAGASFTLNANRGISLPNAGTTGYLQVWGGQTMTIAGGISGPGNLEKQDGGTAVLTGTNTLTGSVRVASGTLTLNSGGSFTQANNLQLAGTMNIGAGSSVLVRNQLITSDASGGTTVLNQTGGDLSVIGSSITDERTNAVVLAHWGSATTYNHSGGTFNVPNAPVLLGWDGTATWNISGTATANVKGIFGQARNNAATINLTGGRLNIGDSGIYNLGSNKLIKLGAGTVGALADWSSSLNNFRLADATTGVTFDPSGKTITLTGALSNETGVAGKLNLNGVGTLVLGGSNSYTGGTTIALGTLRLDNVGGLGATTNSLTVNGGTLNLNANSITTGTLSGTGGTITDNSAGAGTTTLTVGQTAGASFAGAINNGSAKTLALLKNGSGNLTLSGTSNYSGSTAVNVGTLTVSGALGSSAVSVANAATFALSGTGTAAGSITVAAGGVFDTSARGSLFTLGSGQVLTAGRTSSPANDIVGHLATGTGSALNIMSGAGNVGTLTSTGNLTFNGGTVNFDLSNVVASGNDTISLGGVLDLAGSTTLAINRISGSLTNGNYVLVQGTGAVTGSLANLSTTGLISGATRQTFTLSTTTVTNALTLDVAGQAANLEWNNNGGSGTGLWSTNSADTNWNNTTDVVDPDRFYDADNVKFLNISGDSSETVTVTGTVTPATVLVDNTLAGTEYTLAGTGKITGSTAITKQGDGVLVFSNTGGNDYTGATNINAGRLKIGNAAALSAASALSVASGAVIDVNGLNVTVSGVGGAGTVQSDNGASTLTADTSGSTAISALLADGTGGLSLVKQGTGTVSLTNANTYTGGTTVTAGTLSLGNGGTTGSVSGAITNNATLTLNRSDAYAFANNVSGTGAVVHAGAGTASVTGNLTHTGGTTINAGVLSVGNGGTTGSISGNITTNATLAFNRSDALAVGNTISGTGGISQIGSGTTTLSVANSFTGGVIVSNGVLSVSAANNLGSGSGAVALSNGGTLKATASFTIGRGIDAGTGGGTVAVDPTFTLTRNGGFGGGNLLTKSGGGTLRFQSYGGGAFSGSLRITGGVVDFAGGAFGGNLGLTAITVESGTTARVLSAHALGGYYNSVPTITVNDGGVLTFNSENYIQSMVLAGATVNGSSEGRSDDNFNVTVNAGTNPTVWSAGLNGVNRDFMFTVNSGAEIQMTGYISNSRAMQKSGAGLMVLSGNNTYSGGTQVNGGVLQASSIANAGGTGSIGTGYLAIANDGTFRYTGTGTETTNRALWMDTGAATKTIEVTSATGNVTFSSTAGTINKSFQKTGAGALTIAGAISSTATVTVAGGALTLSGNNTYSGATNVNAGVLNIRHGSALGGTGSGTTVADGAALEMQGGISVGNEALGVSGTGVSNGGAVRNISGNNTYGGQITLNANTRINSDAGTLTLDGTIIHGSGHNLTVGGSGDTVINGFITTTSGSLTKDGSGTLTLTQTNAFVGDTTISGGSLALSGSGSVASSNIINNGNFNVSAVTGGYTLGATQTLTGNGTVTGAITIAGTLAIGSSPGTMTFEDDLGLDVGSLSNFEINTFTVGDFDLAQAAGPGTQNVAFDGTLNLLFASGFNTVGSVKIFDFDGYSGNFSTVNTSGLASGFTASFDSTTGIVNVVPEASTTLLFGLGTLGLALRRRRAS